MTDSVRVRIGPSPTGDPHVGTAYIALFNLVFARQHQGKFVLRIEDTDQVRSKPEWEDMICDSLRWLGLQWDEGPDGGGEDGPYRQSERGAIYAEHVAMLLEKGVAYRCFCTAERLSELRAQQRERKENPGYDGHCLSLSEDEISARLAAGEAHVVRLEVPREGQTTVKDHLRGEVVFDNAQIDDQVLLKSDGMPTYHLANIVDDHLMKISHVMRAEEWINSTPKHVLLYEAFGWEAPVFIHMPLLRNSDKSKISKRKNPVSLNYYREAGFLPEAMLNYLGMMGWTMPNGEEQFSVEDMVENFSFDRMSLGGPVFDVKKLTWLNGLYLRSKESDELFDQIRQGVLNDAYLREIIPLVQERIEKFEDFIDQTAFFFSGDVAYDEAATKNLLPKGRTVKEATTMFKAVIDKIDVMAEVSVASVEQALGEVVKELELKPRDVFMPVRIAVTGRKASPSLFETMAVLGKERCRRRLRGAITHLRHAAS